MDEILSLLIGTYGTVHFYAISPVYLYITFVVEPWYSENYYSFGFCHPFKYLELPVMKILLNKRHYSLNHLLYCLMKFAFTRVLLFDFIHESFNFLIHITDF